MDSEYTLKWLRLLDKVLCLFSLVSKISPFWCTLKLPKNNVLEDAQYPDERLGKASVEYLRLNIMSYFSFPMTRQIKNYLWLPVVVDVLCGSYPNWFILDVFKFMSSSTSLTKWFKFFVGWYYCLGGFYIYIIARVVLDFVVGLVVGK